MPTVTSRSSRAASGCQVRSRWSSSSSGRCRATARTISITYSAMGRLKTPRALVMIRPRSSGLRRQDALDAGRRGVDPAQVRAARQQAVEDRRRQRSAQQDLDVVERRVGEALERDGDEARARCRLPDAGEVGRAVARREDGRQRDRRPARRPVRSRARVRPSARPRADVDRPRSCQSVAAACAGPRRTGRRARPRSGMASGPDQRRSSAASPPMATMPDTKRSPRRYCSSLRSSPVSRAMIRSRPRRGAARRASKRSRMAVTSGSRSAPMSSMTQSLKPSRRLITTCISRSAGAARAPGRPRRGRRSGGRQRPSDLGQAADAEGTCAFEEAGQLALEALAQVRPEPGVRLELEGMGRLVERDPGPDVGQRHVQLTRQAADVLLDEEQPARRAPRRTAARRRTGRGRGCPGSRA